MNLEQLIEQFGNNVTIQEIKVVLLGRVMRMNDYDIIDIMVYPPEPRFPGQQVIAKWFVKTNPEGDITYALQASLPSDAWDCNILDINTYHAKKALFFPEDRKVSERDFAWTVFQEIRSGDALQALYVHPLRHKLLPNAFFAKLAV